jgi:hypothetical protein
MLTRCDALIRIPGESEGADKEVAFMEERNKKIFLLIYDWGDFVKWTREQYV